MQNYKNYQTHCSRLTSFWLTPCRFAGYSPVSAHSCSSAPSLFRPPAHTQIVRRALRSGGRCLGMEGYALAVRKWTWRGLNPRPNRKALRFLHAYLGLSFRVTARPKPLAGTLSPKRLHRPRGAACGYLRVNCTAGSRRFGETALGRCLVPTILVGIKLTYWTSIRQRERICFRQLNF